MGTENCSDAIKIPELSPALFFFFRTRSLRYFHRPRYFPRVPQLPLTQITRYDGLKLPSRPAAASPLFPNHGVTLILVTLPRREKQLRLSRSTAMIHDNLPDLRTHTHV